MLMFVYCTCTAKDRLGLMYRFYALEIYKRMKSMTRVPATPLNQGADKYEKILSRYLWGIFYIESFVSHILRVKV